jgi:hypothetical protein
VPSDAAYRLWWTERSRCRSLDGHHRVTDVVRIDRRRDSLHLGARSASTANRSRWHDPAKNRRSGALTQPGPVAPAWPSARRAPAIWSGVVREPRRVQADHYAASSDIHAIRAALTKMPVDARWFVLTVACRANHSRGARVLSYSSDALMHIAKRSRTTERKSQILDRSRMYQPSRLGRLQPVMSGD